MSIPIKFPDDNILVEFWANIKEELNKIKISLDKRVDETEEELETVKTSVSNGKSAIASAITGKGVSTSPTADFSTMAGNISLIQTGIDTGDATATSTDILSGKTAYAKGVKVTGSIVNKSASDITASGADVTVPSGYYTSQVLKSVTTATQATPSITVDSSGKITASVTQSEGYVSSGTKSATKQLATQGSSTITPGTAAKTAVTSGRYTTGVVTVAGDANLVAENIKSGVSIFGVAGSLEASVDADGNTVIINSSTPDFMTATIDYYNENLEFVNSDVVIGGSYTAVGFFRITAKTSQSKHIAYIEATGGTTSIIGGLSSTKTTSFITPTSKLITVNVYSQGIQLG